MCIASTNVIVIIHNLYLLAVAGNGDSLCNGEDLETFHDRQEQQEGQQERQQEKQQERQQERQHSAPHGYQEVLPGIVPQNGLDQLVCYCSFQSISDIIM